MFLQYNEQSFEFAASWTVFNKLFVIIHNYFALYKYSTRYEYKFIITFILASVSYDHMFRDEVKWTVITIDYYFIVLLADKLSGFMTPFYLYKVHWFNANNIGRYHTILNKTSEYVHKLDIKLSNGRIKWIHKLSNISRNKNKVII